MGPIAMEWVVPYVQKALQPQGGTGSLSTGSVLLARVTVFHLPKSLIKIRDLLSNLSLGIYLCHALFLSRLDDWGLSSKLGNPFYSIPLTALVCLILSFMVIFLLSKIPVIGKYIAG